MSFNARVLAAETAFSGCAVALNGTLPGLGTGVTTFVRQLLDARADSNEPLDAFVECMADHLDTLRRESAEQRAHDVDESARTIVATAATLVLRDVAFDARRYLSEHAEDAAAAARSLVEARAARAGLPPEPYLRNLIYLVVEAWFRAMADSPVGRADIERVFRQTLLDRVEPLGDGLAALRDVLLSTPILHTGRESYRRGEAPPSALLDPRFAIVPFQGRQSVLETLTAWCDEVDGPRVSVRLITGPGGRGKTRLVTELARRLRERTDGRSPWRTGLLDLRGTSLAPERLARELRVHERVLVGIDRAEVRREEVLAVLRAARQQVDGSRVRVLLTARRADEWWRTLGSFDPEAALALQMSPAEPLELDVLEPTVEARAEHFMLAHKAFREALANGVAPDDDIESPSALRDEALADPLLLQMAALLSAQEKAVVADETALFGAVLESERSYWTGELSRLVQEPSLRTVEEAATVLTLVQGTADRPSLKALVVTVLRRADRDPLPADMVTDLLHALYGTDGDSTRPVRPDRIGEFLVLENVRRVPALLDTALDQVGKCHERKAIRSEVLTVLDRLAGWRTEGETILRQLLERRDGELIPLALAVAEETRSHVGQARPIEGIAFLVIEASQDIASAQFIADEPPTTSQFDLGSRGGTGG